MIQMGPQVANAVVLVSVTLLSEQNICCFQRFCQHERLLVMDIVISCSVDQVELLSSEVVCLLADVTVFVGP